MVGGLAASVGLATAATPSMARSAALPGSSCYLAIDVETNRRGDLVTEVAIVGRGTRRSWVMKEPDDTQTLREIMAEIPGRVLLGYNVSSDVHALRRWCARKGRRWLPIRSVCLMHEARKRFRLRRARLEDVLRASGITFDRRRLHSALYDAEMAWALWERIGSRPRAQAKRRG